MEWIKISEKCLPKERGGRYYWYDPKDKSIDIDSFGRNMPPKFYEDTYSHYMPCPLPTPPKD